MVLDVRHRYLIARLVECFKGLDEETTVAFFELETNRPTIDAFLSGEGCARLFWFFQAVEFVNPSTGATEVLSAQPQLTVVADDVPLIKSRCFYCIRRTDKAVSMKEQDLILDLLTGTVDEKTFATLNSLLSSVFAPMLSESNEWGKTTTNQQREFLGSVSKLVSSLSEIVQTQPPAIEWRSTDPQFAVENSPQAIRTAASNADLVAHYEGVIGDWCNTIETLLVEPRDSSDELGPNSELDFWRQRSGLLSNIRDKVSQPECKIVVAVISQARSDILKQWKQMDMAITDASNEAKDNVKYLSSLVQFTEPLYSGTPEQIIENLPGLINNIKMMHTISRYYNTTERMTILFVKITNQMILNCKNTIKSAGRLWDQETKVLIKNLKTFLHLNEVYREQYKIARNKLQATPHGKQFDFNELQIFGKFELFCKRVQKLIDVFTTIEQFTALSNYNIDGMDVLMKKFFQIVDGLKRKSSDLLDFTKPSFDKDYIEFNKQIEDLEQALQVFINSSFENISSTQSALSLLKKFQTILQRPNLKNELESKTTVIFHNYGLQLENVKKTYERHKNNPPVVRNAPPVAGNINWCRQLLRRIEEPMQRFQSNETILKTKESKKIIKTYNKVARALVGFETLYLDAWKRSIEAAKAGLQATLIVRHEGRLFVNFDREILQLIRETKWLIRMDIEVPESAKMVLLQEAKFKSYHNDLTHLLKEYDRVTSSIIPVVRPLMRAHLEDLDSKLGPGLTVLTWTSMNIDAYLHRNYVALTKLEELVVKINDIIENRIEQNLRDIRNTQLVNIPQDQSFTLDQFVELQEKHSKAQSHILNIKNLEVEKAVEDLIELICTFPLDGTTSKTTLAEKDTLRKHYNRLMLLAILDTTIKSLNIIKIRIGSRSSGFLHVEKPFFSVNIELMIPNVSLRPTLDDVQATVNRAALAVLRFSKNMHAWGQTNIPVESKRSFYEQVAADKSIVKVVLLLTGGVHGLRQQVMDYLISFKQFEYLWKDDKQKAYEAFMQNKPTLYEFEAELRKYLAIELSINSIVDSYSIGSLNLQTKPLKDALKAEAAAWKQQFAANLHSKAKAKLDDIVRELDQFKKDLHRDINDLQSLGEVMNVLRTIRENETETDTDFSQVEEKYNLLIKYNVRVPKDEHDAVFDLRYKYLKLCNLSNKVNEKISKLQSGFKRDLRTAVTAFKQDVSQFRNEFETLGPIVPKIKPQDAMERLKKYQRLFEERERKFKTYREGEALFGLPLSEYPDLEKTKKELALLDKLYSLYLAVLSKVNGYADILWTQLDFQAITDEVNQFQTQCKKLPKQLREWEAFNELKKTIDDFLELQPLLEQLSDKAMRPRHWQSIMNITGKQFKLENDVFKLRHILEANLLAFKEDVEEVCISAVKEAEIENKLKNLIESWADTQFVFAEFKHRGPVILKGMEAQEIMEKLEDSQMTLGSMMGSRNVAPFREEVSHWLVKLSGVAEVIEQWLGVQAMWIYLEAVFASGDIAKQLPQEAKKFALIDKSWVKIMLKANEVKNVIAFCFENEMLKTLPYLKEQLDSCQKHLSGYLEQKRNLFPRFYFVSDPVLLEILSQSSDPHSIQPALSSIFDSIARVTFDLQQKNKILQMSSSEGEVVEFMDPVIATGNVEDWLKKLEGEMQRTMKEIVREAARECNTAPLLEFIRKYPSQVALLGLQFIWTADCEEAIIRSKTDKKAMADNNKKVAGILGQLTVLTREDLSKLDRTKIETLITIQVHQRDVFDDIVKKKIKDISNFEWQKQARFYWRVDQDECIITIADIDQEYCYEYLGCKERLVITPLTDRCYITLSQALGMKLGGAPAGPAGTGKTETVKDLGRALGKLVVVFNCSDQMDFRAMGKIFKGLAQSGSWGCFDEFNRIELEVLSVVAQQIQCVLTALKERKKNFVFTDGQHCTLIHKTGFFITMNPGYQGRQELPENLKVLFRGVAMMVPDRRIIIKVKLAAAGYMDNEILSKKFNVLYNLCEQQLSKQTHYDFGLRNILSVLRTAGFTKRVNPDKPEAFLLMRTLRDMNMSKLVFEDVKLFLSLINDLFPGMKADKRTFPEVEAALPDVLSKTGLVAHPDWVEKIIQLYETSLVRHGIMVLGPSGSGKTKCFETLLKVLSIVDKPHKEFRMNPKAITAQQMFGRLDPISQDWTDGIFAVLWRKANKQDSKGATWIICDGPVDAIWIENLNTVLDDNKLLTLANGDRIQMAPLVKMCFEVENLNNASPATVSRAGQIYMSESSLGWKPVLESLLTGGVLKQSPCSDGDSQVLRTLFHQHMDKAMEFVQKECQAMMQVPLVNPIVTCFEMCVALIKDVQKASATPPSPSSSLQPDELERLFLFSLSWALGGLLEQKDRLKWNTFLRGISKNTPESNTIFDYCVNPKTLQWEMWQSIVPKWEYPGDDKLDFSTLYVPTVDSVRTEFLIAHIVFQKRPILLIGGSGTAKTVTIEAFLKKADTDVFTFKKLNFSSATTPLIFQSAVENIIEKRLGHTYGPPGGKKMLLMIDDINMPEINEWGDQVTNEIVRQLIEKNGFYSLERIGDWKNIEDVQFLAAMSHPGGGKNDIPNRLKRHFSIFNVTLPEKTSIDQIYGGILRGRYNRNNPHFSSEIINIAEKLTDMTVALWRKIAEKCLPTPSKFHYIFNLRDLSRVYQGIMLCSPETVKSDEILLGLWKHECTRIFSDRLNTAEDKIWFDDTIQGLVRQNIDSRLAQRVEKPMYFVNFLRDPKVDPETGEELEPAPKIYEPIGQITNLRERLENFMHKFNESSKIVKLNLVLFDAALKHLIRISRILSMPRGNALLVGVGGSGKQSLTRLASFIAGYQTFQITLTKSYNVTNLFDDLRNLYKIAGYGKPVTFLFTDGDIKQENFLEYINQVLSSGQVAGLFAKDELDNIVNDMRPIAKKKKPDTIGKLGNDTWDNLYSFFIDNVRDNLHIVLCFSPVGEKFRTRARKFPGLISGVTCDWFFPWPPEALVHVASSFLADFKIEASPEVKSALIQHMGNVHRSMSEISEEYFMRFRRHVYSTPKSYLSFIKNYKDVYVDKHQQINSLAEKVNGGLSKLRKAEEDVKEMKVALKQKEVNLAVAQQNTDKLLKEITESTAITEKKKAEVSAVKEVLAKEAAIVNAGKIEAENDLMAAKPALLEAENALKSITPKDIQLLKAMKTPPQLIKTIFDGVLILRHQPLDKVEPLTTQKGQTIIKDSYQYATAMMADINFLKKLLTFERDSINEETIELLNPYLRMEDFTPDAARKVSSAVAGLCTWVRAMVTYNHVAKDVAPKMEALRVAEAKLRVANSKLKAKEDQLAQVEAELAKIQADFDKAMRKKQELQDDAERTRKRMDAANSLINALSGERDRWTAQSNEFKDLIRRLTGDVALACAFISYCGPFNSEFRELLLQKTFFEDCVKRNIPVTVPEPGEKFDIAKFLVDQAQVGEWNLQGLPTDPHSIQNGIMVTRSTKWPLLVDPQGQGLAWLKQREDPEKLRVCQITDRLFRNYLEDCLSFGKPMIIENVEEEVDPMLDPVLEKALVKSGRSYQIILSDKAVDYNENFRLYLTTKLPNPHFTPEMYAKTTVIDFAVTMDGLEQQLLGRVIQKEKAELEEQRDKLLKDVNSNEKKIKELEDDLLFRLSASQGNLLDDEKLISVLANTKTTASEVLEKLNVAKETEKRINIAREEYIPVARRGSVIYFLIVEMALVNPMYQTSLKQFLVLFDSSILKSAKAPLASKRIKNIIEYLTYLLYQYISRGLFERDKILFVLLLACKIGLREGTISHNAFSALLKGGAALNINTARKKPFDWIPDNSWLNILNLSMTLDKFKALPDLIQRNEKLWKYFYDDEAPEAAKVPDLHDKLDKFEQLLLIRSIREDRTMLAAADFISDSLGKRYIEPVPLDLEATLVESSSRTPLIFLLSLGSDPSAMIYDLAKKKKTEMNHISMGQGQEPAARELINTGFTTGSWVMLQNCHLGLKFLVEVEDVLLNTPDIHPDFRLWITSEPHQRFPIGLLQMSIKLTNEAPQGVKAGLKRSFQWVNQDMLDASRRPEWKPLIYTVCFVHTVIQERRKYGPLGWSVPYEFNQSDLNASFQFLQNHFTAIGDDFTRGPQIQWDTVHYMVCEVQYGGRITDDFDRRLFCAYGDKWLTPTVTKPDYVFLPGYSIPNAEDITKYRESIEQLPLVDSPEVFGMHPNADITYRNNQSTSVLSTILEIQPKKSSGSGGLTREETVLKIAQDILERLPDDFSRDEVDTNLKRLGRTQPLTIFLGQEIDRFQVVVSLTRKTLKELKLAIDGIIIMSAALQDALNSLYDARVPKEWLKKSWPSPNFGLWFSELLGRHDQLHKWVYGDRPKAFWLAGFFNPQGFLTGMRQEVTRAHQGWALDDVVLKTQVTDKEKEEIRDGPSEGVYIYGLYLDGAAWDKKKNPPRLVDSQPKVLFSQLPVLYVTAVTSAEKKTKGGKRYICPCYKRPTRTDLNYIFDVELPTEEDPIRWILRGVALLTSKD